MRHLTMSLLALAGLCLSVKAAQPNVLFIAIDDLVPTLGVYGDAIVQTPRIDDVASRGTTFLNHHVQWSVCGPSRASMTTSLMPEETGVIGFKPIRAVLPDVITLPQHFRNNGYVTACSGKFHDFRTVGQVVNEKSPTRGGHDTDDALSWSIPYNRGGGKGFRPEGHPAVDSTDQADSAYTDHDIMTRGVALLDKIAAAKKPQPFFLAVGFKKPHLGFYAPKRYWDLYERDAFPLATFKNAPANASANVEKMLAKNGELLGYEPYAKTGMPTDAQARELMHGYYACVSFIDNLVGQLVDKLAAADDPIQKGKKLSETTIIVIWGDHGFHLGDHDRWAKHSNLERGSSAPLIIYDPLSPTQGAKTHSPANSCDIYPTLCEMAALPIPEQPLSKSEKTGRPLRGSSLIPLLKDPSASVNVGAMNMFGVSGGYGYAYRTERFRYIEWINSSDKVTARDLYDYEKDPLEKVNLEGDPEYKAIVEKLSQAMRADRATQGMTRLQKSAPYAN